MSGAPRGPRKVRGPLFARELKSMMYAFGDVEDPLPETVAMMESILVDYLTQICHEAGRVSGQRAKVKVDDFRFVLRNDSRKLGRVEELLRLQKVIADARKQFDDKDE